MRVARLQTSIESIKINFNLKLNPIQKFISMKTISMLEFRQDAEKVIRQIQAGQRLILTYRGKPVARLEPLLETAMSAEDPFYTLYRLADTEGESLTNSEMDKIVYAL